MAYDEIDAAFRASPLFAELNEIGESDDVSRFDSDAKRQHFVPQLLLRGFSDDGNTLFQLDSKAGPIVQTDIASAASRRYLYASWEDGKRNNRIEGFFARVESHAAPALKRMHEDPLTLSGGDRATLSYFFAVQTQRTPAAAARITAAGNALLQTLAGSELSDPEEFAKKYQNHFGREDPPGEIEAFRLKTIRAARAGDVSLADPGGAAFAMGIKLAVDQSLIIFEFDWTVLRCPGAFVASDRGFAIHDPAPKYPWSTQGLLSSPKVETTIPLSTDICLVLRPIGRGIGVQDIPPNHAEGVNLRTYGWADSYVFGASRGVLEATRDAAEKRPEDVIRPKPHHHVTLIDADPDDESFAEENRRRGWPPQLMHEGVPHDYVVIAHDKPTPELQERIDAALEQRERKRQGITDGSRPRGRIRTSVPYPPDIS